MKHIHKHYGGRPLWQWFLLYFVIGGIAYAAFYSYQNKGVYQGPSNGYTSTGSTKNTTPKSTVNTPAPAVNVEAQMTYEEALKTYAGSRIQFSETCVASPTSLSLRKGASILLDNRASKARYIYLDDIGYSLGAYGYKIVKLTTNQTLPHTMRVDCGNGKANATIIISQ